MHGKKHISQLAIQVPLLTVTVAIGVWVFEFMEEKNTWRSLLLFFGFLWFSFRHPFKKGQNQGAESINSLERPRRRRRRSCNKSTGTRCRRGQLRAESGRTVRRPEKSGRAEMKFLEFFSCLFQGNPYHWTYLREILSPLDIYELGNIMSFFEGIYIITGFSICFFLGDLNTWRV